VKYLLAALVWLAATSVGAQSDRPLRDVQVVWVRGTPKVSFSAKDLADERVRRELQSALRKRLVVTVSAHPAGSGRTIVRRQFACDVTRDLWDEGYLVRIANRTERLPSLEKAIDRCLVVQGLFVGDDPERFERYRGEQIYFSVKAEFNPISDKQCRELIRPSGSDAPVGPITVSIVRRRICQAERTVEFRSEEVAVPQ
jgi:hypothetical protein